MNFTDREHKTHCRKGGCAHPAVHFPGCQGWCARCRAVAFGGVYEGLAYIDGAIVNVASRKALPS